MSYRRVIPRDLFNEANLLKCLGRVALLIEDGKAPDGLQLEHTNSSRGFAIEQDPGSGDICCTNLALVTQKGGRAFAWRGLNSRDGWSIFINARGDEEIAVFNDDGSFTEEFSQWANESI